MSEPKRYALKVNEENDFDLIEHSNGEYIRYEDYARLKAECQARQAENSVLAVECDSLKAEVERLTKAGDEMHEQATNTFQPHSLRLAMEAWNAAKKGGQP